MEYIVKYWSQIALIATVLFAGIGHLLKIILDARFKKSETKFSLFYNKKIVAMENFIVHLKEYERFYNDLPYHSVYRREISPQDLDLIIKPYRDKFYVSHSIICMYCDDESLGIVNRLNMLMSNSSRSLSKLLFKEDIEVRIYDTDDYLADLYSYQRESEMLIKDIINKFSKEYR